MKEQGESVGRESERKKYGDAASAQGVGGRGAASECVSQPALDTTGSVALTAACQSLGRGSSMCAWGGG